MSLQAKLTVVGGKASKRTVALQLPTSIGRSRDADLTVAHPQISRNHCELVEAEGLILIRDCGSLNGTYVNSQRVKEAPLPPDATFSIGPLTFRVRYQYDGDSTDLPPTIPAEEPPEPKATGEISETLPVQGTTVEELDELVIEDLIEDEPSADEPVADEPVVDEPVADEPVADEPVADEPVAEDELPDFTPVVEDSEKTDGENQDDKSDPGDDALDDFLKGLT